MTQQNTYAEPQSNTGSKRVHDNKTKRVVVITLLKQGLYPKNMFPKRDKRH